MKQGWCGSSGQRDIVSRPAVCDYLRRRLALFVMMAITVGVGAGCVRRTMTITTDPQGANVYLNDREVGTSPVTLGFTWYGDYDIILRKDGYDTLKTNHRLEAPWYELPPLDLIAEAFIPTTIEDHHEIHFSLTPAEPVDHETLLERATEFRERALFEEE